MDDTETQEAPAGREKAPRGCDRRTLLRRSAAAAVAPLVAPGVVRAARRKDDPRRLPPQPGDLLAFPTWEGDGRALRPADVIAGAAPLSAFPAEPETGLVRERSRLNQVLVVRLDPAGLSERTRASGVDGIVAYSGVCTHTACGVSEWDADAGHFVCPCHASQFDPSDGARVVSGPAPRALPALPIRVEADRLVVESGFTGRPGADGA